MSQRKAGLKAHDYYMTEQEIADELGLTRAHVTRIIDLALKKLRRQIALADLRASHVKD